MARVSTTTPDRTPDGWGSVAAAYDEAVAPVMTRYAQAALDATDLKAGERVLDVAAGSGALTLSAARRGAEAVAVDLAPPMIERLKAHARREGLPIEAHVMDGQALTFPHASFDAAYVDHGLMFFPDPDQGLVEMHRVLRAGGRCGIVTWAPPDRSPAFRTFFDALAEAAPDLPPTSASPAAFGLCDPDAMDRRMARAGFRGIEVATVEHVWEQETPEAMWDAFTRTNPVIPGLLGRVGDDTTEAVREAFVRRAAAHTRKEDGMVALSAEALLTTATK